MSGPGEQPVAVAGVSPDLRIADMFRRARVIADRARRGDEEAFGILVGLESTAGQRNVITALCVVLDGLVGDEEWDDWCAEQIERDREREQQWPEQ